MSCFYIIATAVEYNVGMLLQSGKKEVFALCNLRERLEGIEEPPRKPKQ